MAETPPSRVSYDFVTRAIARTLGNPGKGYYALLALAVALLGVGIVCLLFLLRYGLGLAGYSHPVYWAVYITCFVFWVGIAHSGTLISAILFLFRSGWRTAVRSEEHTSELQSRSDLVCRLLLEKKKKTEYVRPSTQLNTTAVIY